MQKPTVSVEKSPKEISCFNGVGGSGRESEFMREIAPTMAKLAQETDLLEFLRPQIQKFGATPELSCFNGVGGSGREALATLEPVE